MSMVPTEFRNSLFVSDLHARHKDQIWARRPEITGDGAYAVEEILKYVRELGVHLLFLGGDITDIQPQRSDSIDLLRRLLSGAMDLGATVFFVQGQHDMSNPPILSSIDPRAIHVHGKSFKIGGVECYALDYVSPSAMADAADSVPTTAEILLTHQVWTDFMGEERGHARSQDFGVQTIVTGDYHRPTTVVTGNVGVYSPGPPHIQAWGEVAGGALWLGPDGEAKTPIHVEFDRRAYLDVQVGEDDTDFSRLVAELDPFVEEHSAHYLTPVVRITCGFSQLAGARAAVESRYEEGLHSFYREIPDTVDDAPVPEPEYLASISDEKAVSEFAVSEEQARDVLTILNSSDPFTEAQNFIQSTAASVGGEYEIQ